MRSILLFAILLSASGCERDELTLEEENANNEALKEIIQYISVPSDSIPADGQSLANIEVRIYRHTDTVYRTLHYQSSIGNFLNNEDNIDISVNAEGTAVAQLKSLAPGKALIRTSVRGISIDTSILFKPALPIDLEISSDKYTPSINEPVVISLSMFRPIGTVTDGVRLDLNVVPENPGAHELIFPAFVISDDGSATFTITNPFEVTGWVKVSATTRDTGNHLISRAIRIRYQ